MSCSLRKLTNQSSWKNDRGILFAGIFFLALYFFLSYFLNLLINEDTLKDTAKHVHDVLGFSRANEDKIIKYFSLLWHIFWVSAISGFIGIPIARGVEGCLGVKCEQQYTKLRNSILLKGSLYSCRWNNILLILQENRHVSSLAQLKKYISDGEKLDIPEFSGIIGSIRHVSRISKLLLSVENTLHREGESECEKLVSFYRSRVRLLHFRTDAFRYVITLVYFIFPTLIALLLALSIEGLGFHLGGIFSFFLGAALILSSVQIAMLSYSFIGFFTYIWRKQCKRFDDMIFRIYALVISLVIFVAIFVFGVLNLYPSDEIFSHDIKTLVITTANVIFPFMNMSVEFNLVQSLPQGLRIVVQVSAAIVFSIVLKHIFEYVLGKYEQSTSGEQDKHFSVPSELVGIFGSFFIFIITTALIYSSLILQPVNKAHQLAPIPVQVVSDGTVSPSSSATNIIKSEVSVATSNGAGEGNKLGNFLPYSIFLALVGAVLAISTRELLENYFAGISMKVDMPFEQGDRLSIEKIGMCEVREVGLRSVKLYSIANNSIVSIPNKEISKDMISNYTQPTLDYRRSLSLNVAAEFIGGERAQEELIKKNLISATRNDFRFIRDCSNDFHGVVETAKSLLLIAAFLSTGVKRPSAKRFFIYNWALEKPSYEVTSPDKGIKNSARHDIKKYKQNAEFFIDSSKDLFSTLESVALERDYHNVDKKELELIWYRLKLIQKINDKPLRELFLMDVPHLLDDASIIEHNVMYMDTDYVKRSKVRVAKILYILFKLEHKKYGLLERDYAGVERLDPSIAWSLSNYVQCLTNQYFSLNELLWGLKSESEGQAGKKSIDSARLKFQNIPRVSCEQKESSEGYVYWRLDLAITVGLGEQSDEVLYNIYKRIDWYWELTGLSKDLHIKTFK